MLLKQVTLWGCVLKKIIHNNSNVKLPAISIVEANGRLESWIEGQAFKGWDPFDALNNPLLKRLAFGNRRLGQVWVQALKRSPINIRPVLGAHQGYNPKAMGLFLVAYLRKYLLFGRSSDLARVRFFQDWLNANISPGYSESC